MTPFAQISGEETTSSQIWRPVNRAEIELFVRSLSTVYDVIGVQEMQGRLMRSRIGDPSALVLDFPPRVHSPKKFLFPNGEKLFRFRLGGKVHLETEKTSPPQIIFGMHPCDLHAVRILDDCLLEGEADSSYRALRDGTVLIGVDCQPDAHCFCTSMGTDRVAEGFDLFLHHLDGNYLIQTGSSRGEALLHRHAPRIAARPGEPPLPLQVKQCTNNLNFPSEALPALLEGVYDHPGWEEIGSDCLGCGACNLLCPTCYCFNVHDRLDLNLHGGDRIRTWESCQFDQFTKVAGGDNFRGTQAERQRHRFFRKHKYLREKHQRTGCVGCGRCSRECLSQIEPVAVLNGLFELQEGPVKTRVPGAEYQPQMAEIAAVRTLSEREKLLRLRLADPVRFEPGTFMEVSVFGLGEAPFTIASAPDGGRELEIVVRAAGNLTRALHRLRAGDQVGVRGPFGCGFRLPDLVGSDILLVAGGRGLITLRSLLLTILSRRDEFGRVILLYGARNLESLLFHDDLLAWHQGGELDCRLAISDAGGDWCIARGEVSHLFRDLDLVPHRTIAAISGPPGMYRSTNPLLFQLGFDEDRVFLNLERHMKCGLGKCGKCQINDICVCQCGPIFPYSKVRHLREAIER